jgi:hypothetical protein
MKNKIFTLTALFLCFLFLLSFSFVNADYQALQNLKAKKERITKIKESVDYLIRFSEEENKDKSTIKKLEDIGVVAESIELQIEEEIESETKKIAECLEEEDLVIYIFKGSSDCDYIINQFGDYDFLDAIYVECSDQVERCLSEMKDPYVPEVQIKGEVYQGVNTIYYISKAAGCVF